MKSAQRGFTLIELMVAVGIIGIVSSIAVLNFVTALPNYKLHTAARDFSFLLRKARSTAIKERRPVIIEFLLTDGGARSDGRVIFDAEVRRQSFPEGGSLTSYYGGGVQFGFGAAKKGASSTGKLPANPLSFQHNRVMFNSEGLNTGGYVYLTNARDEAFAVGANSTGVIMLKHWNGKEWQ